MKKLILTVLVVVASLVSFAQPHVVAHRGYWSAEGSAQNSLTALCLAAEAGCWGSEFDVWMTADGVCVVNHDAVVDGKKIEESRYEELRSCRLKNGETLPTLEQYLWSGLHFPQLKLVLEVKPHSTPERDVKCADEVLRLVKKYGAVDQTDYISFSLRVCERLVEQGPKVLAGPNGQRSGKRIDKPKMHVACLSGDLSPEEVKAKGLTGIDYEQKVLLKEHPEWIEECHRLGLTVNIWTVDDLDNVWEARLKGIDFITTDRPVEALKLTR